MSSSCNKFEIPPAPIVTGGMVHHAWGQKGKKMGGGRKVIGNGTSLLAAHLFPSLAPDNAPAIPFGHLTETETNTQLHHTMRLHKSKHFLAKRNLILARVHSSEKES